MSETTATRVPAEGPVIRPIRTLWLVAALHATNHAIGFLFPLIYLAVKDEFGIGADTIAFLAAVGTFGSGLLQLAFSGLTRVAARRVLLAAGGIVMGLGMLVQSLAVSFLAFATANVTTRLGGAPQHPVGNGLLAEQFPPERRGFAISAHIAGGNVGTVAVPIVGAWLIAAQGWRTAVVVFGIPAIVVSLAILGFVRESGTDRAAARAAGSLRDGFRALFADRGLRWLFVSAILGGGGRGLGIVNLFALLYLTTVAGVDADTAALMYAVLIIFSVPMPLVAGWLSDRVGRKPVILAVYAGGAIGFIVFVSVGQSLAGLWAAIILMGTFTFAESPQLQALLADTTPSGLRDITYSAYFTAAFVAAAVWTFIYGAVIGAMGETAGLPVVFWLMAGAFILSSFAILPVPTGRESERTTA